MFWTNFSTLCADKNLSPNAVATELKIPSGSITAWRNGATPRTKSLTKIANYFGVTVDYLLTGEQKEKAPDSVGGLQVTPKKRELIDKVMKMDDKQLDLLKKLLDATEQATK